MKVLAVLQARTSSQRMPGKVLTPLLGRPMILRHLERISRCTSLDGLVVATSSHPSDDALFECLAAEGVAVHRGSLENVLERFFCAAEQRQPEHVVRLTGDCPLADPAVIDKIVHIHLEQGNDYTSNVLPPTYPDGLDAEAMTIAALTVAHREARLPSELEHVTSFINRRPDRFKIGNVLNDEDFSTFRWTVDEPEDFQFVRAVYENLYPSNPGFGMQDVLGLLSKQPYLIEINKRFARNEGLLKSLEADQEVSK
jgi:spore coat polysaccharide biosynthesis protein SpsF (cytidylyltransferase family)